MMQRSWRLAAGAVLTGLLTTGGITAGMTAAQANLAGFCHGTGTAAKCSLTETIKAPTSVTVGVTATPTNGNATVTWTATCTLSDGTSDTVNSGTTSATPAQDALTPLPGTSAGQCVITATVSLPTTDANNAMTVAMTYTTASTPSPSPSSTTPAPSGHVVRGYAGKCLDDAGNSSANLAKVQIWSCNSNDKAQLWTYSNGELVHNGKCVNDQAWGGKGTKVSLYTCNHALNELWTHLANGEYVLNAKGYKLCLDDPASSTRNGTQLIVYTCHNAANQHWQMP